MLRLALSMFATLAACAKSEPTTEAATEAKTEAATVSLRGTGPFPARLEVPGASSEAPQAHIDRLRSALLRRDPAGTAEVVGRERDQGGGAFVLAVAHSPAYTDGIALTKVADDMKTAFHTTAEQRGVKATFEDTRGARHIDVDLTVGTPPAQTRTRSRLFITDRLYEIGCQCVGELCAAMPTCALPDPPADALPIAQAMQR